MKWITHIALAFFAVKVVEIAFLVDLFDSHLAYAVVSAFAVLPDVDYLIRIKHRTWTHTIWFTLTALPLTLMDWKLALVGWIAILSHLAGDMMTHSGVKLLLPYRETVFYLIPPNWRFKTGSSGEFLLLGVLIIGSILIGTVETKSELVKTFELSRDHDVTARFSYFENGVIHRVDSAEIVWTDGKRLIGIIEDHKLVLIKDDQIMSFEILSIQPIERLTVEKTIKIKSLKRSIWKDRLIIGYEKDGYHEFLGTGYQLWERLKSNETEKVKVWSLNSYPTSPNKNKILTTFTNLANSISQGLRFIESWTS